ncbi:Rod shape-determining protein MreD [Roseivirga sp.]|uniref:Rod shape-determining protein MreD n=1 Tax=Roseivirga sp. TaxID=1964215 RepID=UPI003B8C48FE
MNRNTIILIASFAVLIPLQIFVFQNFVFFNLGFCFIYLLFLLSLPLETSIIAGMCIALVTGLLIDIFYQTLGIHAAAGVFMMFLKPYWLKLNVPRSGYEAGRLPLIREYGLGWFIFYALPLILVYTLAVLFIEAGNSALFWLILSKALVTTLVTLLFIIVSQYIFYPKSKY